MGDNDVRRVSSAGYRLPERPSGTAAATRHLGSVPKLPEKSRKEDGLSAQHPSKTDSHQQDQLWKERVQSERTAVKEWEKNWGFLKNYDQLGRPRVEAPLPSSVSMFSDQFPNTTYQMLGSRLSTPLGRELMRMDRLVRWAGRSKPDPELCPK